MSHCPNCGTQVEEGSAFCAQCGTPVNAAPQQPAYEQPQQPTYQQPVYQQPVYQPTYQQPAYQPAYQQPVYTQPTPVEPESNKAAAAGMVLGIIAMAFTLVGILCCASYVAAILGVILLIIGGILMLPGIGLSIGGVCGKNKPNKGKAVAGLVLNGLILIAWLIILLGGAGAVSYYF